MTRRCAIAAALVALALPGATAAAAAEAPAPSTERYGSVQRVNQPITMADGTVLRANVTVPTDPKTGAPAAGRFPVVITETAYGKDLAQYSSGFTKLLGDPEYFARRGFVSVLVDVRGTGTSEGIWTFNDPQEAKDSVEVIHWAAGLPESNGRVGMVGASYLGITQLFAAAQIGRGSPLKAIFPMVASNSIFREAIRPGGLLDAEGAGLYLGLTAGLNLANPLIGSGGDPAVAAKPIADHLRDILEFQAVLAGDLITSGPRLEDGDFWRARGPERVLDQIVANRIPAFLVGGLDDLFQSGVFRNYVGLQNAWAGRTTTLAMDRHQRVTGRYQALVGPWFHAVIGKGGPDLQAIAVQWFDRWLRKVPNGIEKTRTPLRIIERDRKEHVMPRWPIARATPQAYALGTGGTLTTGTAQPGKVPVVFTGVSLPCNRSSEVWALGIGQALADALGVPEPCADGGLQPPLPAPLTQQFTTPSMTRPTTIAGPITASLTISSTTADAELVAKLYDVAPDGKQRELTMGAQLASWRAIDESLSWRGANGLLIYPHHPVTYASRRPLKPGEPTRVEVELAPTVHTLKPGHRLRLVLAGGEFPARFPLPADLPNLLGSVASVHLGGASQLNVPELP